MYVRYPTVKAGWEGRDETRLFYHKINLYPFFGLYQSNQTNIKLI